MAPQHVTQLPQLIRITTAACLAAGVVCQFLQHTDPTFPLAYFTVDSAALAALIATTGAVTGRRYEPDGIAAVRGAATVGVIFSGLVYATVIAPATPTGTWFQPGDDLWVQAATVLMHGAGPILVTTDFLTHPYPAAAARRAWATAVRWCGWPLLYLVVMIPVQLTGTAKIPYPFLQPAQVGGWVAVTAIGITIAGIMTVLGRILLAAHTRMHSTAKSNVPHSQDEKPRR